MLQTLRQPLESGEIVLHRAFGAVRYPARFQLVMAANPCPCGHFIGNGAKCECSALSRRRYFARLSGPLLDRIDLHVDVAAVTSVTGPPAEPSSAVAERVLAARERARERFASLPWALSAHAPASWLHEFTPAATAAPVIKALERGSLSARGVDRTLRVAWTLADLAGASMPDAGHTTSAMVLRMRTGAS